MDASRFGMTRKRVDVEQLGQWKPATKAVWSPVPSGRFAESEAMYQVMMLARDSRETNRRVFNLRGRELPWGEILRRLTAEDDGADAACD